MRTAKKVTFLIAICLIINQAYAQYEIQKHSISNGGGKANGGIYELTGSLGQIDAGSTMSNGSYTINGGFWQQNNDLIFKNNFE